LNRPNIELAIAINAQIRKQDEWFAESDDIERLANALGLTESEADSVSLAAAVAYRVARAQAFSEGNKRTALLLALWVLDNNGFDAEEIIPAEDQELWKLLVQAASGLDVETKIRTLLTIRISKT